MSTFKDQIGFIISDNLASVWASDLSPHLLSNAVRQNLSKKKVRTTGLGGCSKKDEVGDDIVRIL